jgi:acyl carrier protein
MEEDLILYKLEILQLVETKYSIEIRDEEVEKLITLSDLIDLIKQKL